MRLISCLFFSLFLLGKCLAQKEPQFRWGIQAGNNLSVPGFDNSPEIEANSLLRFSIGTLVRQDLRKNIKLSWGGLTARIYFFMDYGLNFVVKGYDYEVGNLGASANHFAFEIPVALVMKGGNNEVTWSWRKKNLNAFIKLGFKLSYSPDRQINQFKTDAINNEALEEQTQIGGWNILYHYMVGIMKTRKNGAISSLGISANLGFSQTVDGQIRWINNGQTSQGNFARSGSYFSLDLNHFFGNKKKKIDRQKLYPVILCPKF